MEEVKIKLKAIQKNIQDEDTVELVTEGSYYEKNGKQYYTYMETEISGMEGTKTLIKVSKEENKIQIIRYGEGKSTMTYILGEKTNTEYVTPYGNMDMEIHTHEVKINLDENGRGTIYLHYYLDLMGEELNNIIDIEIR